jgi:hypothetical protein
MENCNQYVYTSYNKKEHKSNLVSPHNNYKLHLKNFDAEKRLYICILMFCKIQILQMEVTMRLLV